MKIVEQYDPAGVLMMDLPVGELFVYRGSYYMKIQDPIGYIVLPALEGRVPAINLATGELTVISETERVPPIYARIRINGRAD